MEMLVIFSIKVPVTITGLFTPALPVETEILAISDCCRGLGIEVETGTTTCAAGIELDEVDSGESPIELVALTVNV